MKSTFQAENKSQSNAQTQSDALEDRGIGAMQLQSIYPPLVHRKKDIVSQLEDGDDGASAQSANHTSL
ncbi:MAG: hypothetical protein QNL86_02410, partial [Crocinitomicaceae bacterium]